MHISVSILFFMHILLSSPDLSVDARAIRGSPLMSSPRILYRQGFASLGTVKAEQSSGSVCGGQGVTDSQPARANDDSDDAGASGTLGSGAARANGTDIDHVDDDDDVDVDVRVVPLPSFVLPVADSITSSGSPSPTDQDARRDLAGYSLSFTTRSIASTNNVVLHGVPVDPVTLGQALRELQASTRSQQPGSSNRLKVDGGNLSVIAASAVTGPSQNMTLANLLDVIEVFLQDHDAAAGAINATYVGVIKDSQLRPMINIVILPIFSEVPIFANGTVNTGPSGPGETSTAALAGGPSRALQSLSNLQTQTQRVPHTALKLLYSSLSLTASRAVMNELIGAASDAVNTSGSLLGGYISRLYFTAPGAKVALNIQLAANEQIVQMDMTQAMKAIQHAAWTASKMRSGKVPALQGMIFEGTKSVASWYFSSLPSDGSAATRNYVGIVRDEL